MFRRNVLTLMLTAVLGALAFATGASTALSQDNKFPSHTIHVIVPFAPGGGVDALARMVAENIRAKAGVTVIVENRAGANGTVGGSYVKQAQPDGYTVLFSSNTQTMSKLVMANAPYDPLTDFTPIARLGEAPLLVVMSPQLPQKTLAEVAAAIKQNPDRWTAGTPAMGSPSHIATIQFMRLSGTKLTVTPYRGTAPALTDVSGGHIQLLTDAMIVLLPMAKGGQVKGLAVTTAKRSALAPEIPTAAESGLPGLDVVAWYGVWGPKGMPTEVVKNLNAAFADAMRELAQSGQLASIGVEPVHESPEQFARYVAAEVARNAELLKSVNFQPQ